MSLVRKELAEYIKYVRKLYNEEIGNNDKLIKRIVIGNSSGDMDSVISSISYSYLNYLRNKDIIYPIISFLKEDLKLRKDIEFSLNKIGIYEEDLIYFNELINYNYKIILVDHNEIDNLLIKKILDEGKGEIIGIIDHHVDNGKYLNCKPRIIKICGSCSSLVFEYFKNELKEIKDFKDIQFLSTAIGIDTNKLKQRVENEDLQIYNEILNKVISTNEFNQYIDIVNKEKHNIKGLSIYDLMRKDYKEKEIDFNNGQIIRIGISSIGYSYQDLVNIYCNGTDDSIIIYDIAKWKNERKLDYFVLMTAFCDKNEDDKGKFKREIGIFSSARNRENVLKILNKISTPLNLIESAASREETCASLDACFKLFNQLEISKSRKAVLPLLCEATAAAAAAAAAAAPVQHD